MRREPLSFSKLRGSWVPPKEPRGRGRRCLEFSAKGGPVEELLLRRRYNRSKMFIKISNK
ncbi:hypothetical protein F2Q70_00040591 [Brassica cretica]|uniref:Uncharacterized protein n=1 Tax=Brassica cretica TaxID=69181 RepID=A0A8S9K8Z9_BRACR|nr:hypothetical protein F2Q70_00040591 [Brassica cretica]